MSCYITVWCDWPNCYRFWKTGRELVHQGRAQAALEGDWAYTGGHDLCPEHAVEHAQQGWPG